MKKTSYCKLHDTIPADDEPCWQCVNQFYAKTLDITRSFPKDVYKGLASGNITVSFHEIVGEFHITVNLTQEKEND